MGDDGKGHAMLATVLTLVSTIIAILGFFGVAKFTDVFGTSMSNSSSYPSYWPSQSPRTTAVTSAGCDCPVLTISPNNVQAGDSFDIKGRSFDPGSKVTLVKSTNETTIGTYTVKSDGTLLISRKIDIDACDTVGSKSLTYTVYDDNDRKLASAVLRFCT